MFEYVFNKIFERADLKKLIGDLNTISPQIDGVNFIRSVIEWFYLASFWGIVKGSLTQRVEQFSNLASKETKIDKRAFQLVLINVNSLNQLESDNSIIVKYLEGSELPENIDWLVAGENIREHREVNSQEFWLNVGETLEPVRGELELFSDFGRQILTGDLFKKILVLGLGILLIKLLITKKPA